MKTVKKLAIGFAFAASFITTAFASTVDTSSGGYYDGYEAWGTFEVGNITFATGTNAIMALTTSVDIADQGWGGECPACEPVYIALFDTKKPAGLGPDCGRRGAWLDPSGIRHRHRP